MWQEAQKPGGSIQVFEISFTIQSWVRRVNQRKCIAYKLLSGHLVAIAVRIWIEQLSKDHLFTMSRVNRNRPHNQNMMKKHLLRQNYMNWILCWKGVKYTPKSNQQPGIPITTTQSGLFWVRITKSLCKAVSEMQGISITKLKAEGPGFKVATITNLETTRTGLQVTTIHN